MKDCKKIHEVLDQIYLDNEYAYNMPLMAAVLLKIIQMLKEVFPEEAHSYDSTTHICISKDAGWSFLECEIQGWHDNHWAELRAALTEEPNHD